MLDRYASGPLAGRPAATRRERRQRGRVVPVARCPTTTTLDALLGDLLDAAGVAPVVAGLPAGVEAVRRRSADGSWLFLANDTGDAQEVAVAGHDLVAERDVDVVRLGPGEVAVVREP